MTQQLAAGRLTRASKPRRAATKGFKVLGFTSLRTEQHRSTASSCAWRVLAAVPPLPPPPPAADAPGLRRMPAAIAASAAAATAPPAAMPRARHHGISAAGAVSAGRAASPAAAAAASGRPSAAPVKRLSTTQARSQRHMAAQKAKSGTNAAA